MSTLDERGILATGPVTRAHDSHTVAPAGNGPVGNLLTLVTEATQILTRP
jgi:hypothetical protein